MEKITTKIFEGHVKAFNDEELTIDHFISTEAPDRVNDIMRADGMEMDGVPTVLKQHGEDIITGNEPIAKPLSISVSTNADGVKGILVKTQYYNGKNLTPPDNTGQRLYEKAKENFMPYWSIGFRGVEAVPRAGGGIDFKKWKLFEYSQVGVPENIQARVLKSMDAAEVNKEANNILSFGLESKANPDDGGSWKYCVCKDCGHVEDHKAGEPCGECPECKNQMHGSNEKSFETVINPDNGTPGINLIKDIDDKYEVIDSNNKKITIESRGGIIVTADALNDEHRTLIKEYFEPVKTNLKSIAERVAQDIPWDAMRSIWFAMLDELWASDGTPKTVKAILKEMFELITPFAEAFALATTDNNDMIETKNQITKQLYIDTEEDVAEPAPTSQVNKNKSPSAIVNAILQLQKKPESKPKSILNIGKKELSDIMKGAVSAELKSTLDKMRGKV